jgi:hypothetical protein
MHWQKSYKFGRKQEVVVLPIIQEFFKDEIITRNEYQFSKWDFSSPQSEFELKSRTNEYSKYPTTMITMNKCDECNDKRTVLLFNFTDGLYYIEYEKDLFSTFSTSNFSRAKVEWDKKPHVYIPIEHLKLIKKYSD